MKQLSTKGIYGLKAMLVFAVHYTDGPISLKTVAQKINMSDKYLEHLASSLKKSKLIKSIRGSQGGYFLATEPENITVGMILRSLEGSLAPTECVADSNHTVCGREDFCIARYLWTQMNKKINSVIDSITLKDLIEKYNKEISDKQLMYYI